VSLRYDPLNPVNKAVGHERIIGIKGQDEEGKNKM
jgi:hypothetical protein